MTGQVNRLLAVVVLLAACGGAPTPVRIDPPVGSARPAVELPPAPPGSIWADGFGPTLREASQDAKRAVAEQISAKLQASLDAREQEDSSRGSRREVDARVRTESQFEHLHLVEVRGEAQVDGGFIARAWVARRRVVDAYLKDLGEARARLAELLPTVEAAAARGDTTTLLSVERSPGAQLDRIARIRRLVEHLGGQVEASAVESDATRIEVLVATQRAKTVLFLSLEGELPPRLRESVTAEVVAMFGKRGCDLRLGVPVAEERASAETVPTVHVRVAAQSRDHKELGMRWRYLGLEIEATDMRTGGTVLRFVGLPELAKGGGRDEAQADQALARALGERLAERAGPTFEHIACAR
jgi:acetolactate synthase regulatory subunit